jgi:hypothetical protein
MCHRLALGDRAVAWPDRQRGGRGNRGRDDEPASHVLPSRRVTDATIVHFRGAAVDVGHPWTFALTTEENRTMTAQPALVAAGLLQRDRERALLVTALEEAAAGAGARLAVEGEAGIGSTRRLPVRKHPNQAKPCSPAV